MFLALFLIIDGIRAERTLQKYHNQEDGNELFVDQHKDYKLCIIYYL